MSSTGVYRCCNDVRRERLRAQTKLNGIDYLEVVDHDAPVLADRQRFLRVHFVRTPAPQPPPPAQPKDIVVIDGGERIRNIVVKDAHYDGQVLVVEVVARGDFSPYTLRLVKPGTHDALDDLDPQLASVDFSFKVECESGFDCRADDVCPPDAQPAPRIDYLARDYGSFRRLMLDRIALLVPGWRERTPADFGVTLVELLAYVADRLSYQQDSIATEAYLRTARRRVSMRRHVRLVDYVLRDGCNARVFMHVAVTQAFQLPAQTRFVTRLDGAPHRIDPGPPADEALARGPLVFESLAKQQLEPDQNDLRFYTWQSTDCCLPRGATAATLVGHPTLRVGDFVLFREVLGPQTGRAEDADRAHRHVVKLTSVVAKSDPLAVELSLPADITEIAWDGVDALPFPLCISTTLRKGGQAHVFSDVSMAIGNLVIADHGRSVDETFAPLPAPTLFRPPAEGGDVCTRGGPVAVIPRFRPRLSAGPLTESAPLDRSSAHAVLNWRIEDVLPAIGLTRGNEEWFVRPDLLESDPSDPHFVAEVEDDGIATLRFGDDVYGRRPDSGDVFIAHYRVGNGIAGNVGPNAITHVISADTRILFAWNPIGARGGVEPETIAHARRSAPAAFSAVQERAVTEADYGEVTRRHPGVDRAVATFRWTGSWHTIFDSIDRAGGLEVDEAFRKEILGHVEHYRVIGKDAEVPSPLFVSIELALAVCVRSGYFRAEVERELRDVLTSGLRRDGRPGFFHPDSFSFGEPVILSRIVAAAAAVEGVDAVVVERFRRQGQPLTDAIDTGVLTLGRLEIARLENSRDFPEHGKLTVTMRGGV